MGNEKNSDRTMSRRAVLGAGVKSIAAIALAGAATGCSIIHEINPSLAGRNNIPRTSLTRPYSEEKADGYNNIGDIVSKKGLYSSHGFEFIKSDDYVQVCQQLGINPSTEPRILTATKLNIRNPTQNMDYDVITDHTGKIDLGELVLQAEGKPLDEVRTAIKSRFGPETQVNIVTREGDPQPNYGQAYYAEFTTGREGQVAISKRRLAQIATALGLTKSNDYIFIHRENESHRFVLVYDTRQSQNIPLAHNDLLLTGIGLTDAQELDRFVGKIASIISNFANGTNSAVTIDKSAAYFEAPAALQNPQYQPK